MVPSNNLINIQLVNVYIFVVHRIIMKYFLLGVLAPIVLNLIHLGIGLFITKNQGNTFGVGFSAIGFFSKTAGMVFLTWLGVSYLELNWEDQIKNYSNNDRVVTTASYNQVRGSIKKNTLIFMKEKKSKFQKSLTTI